MGKIRENPTHHWPPQMNIFFVLFSISFVFGASDTAINSVAWSKIESTDNNTPARFFADGAVLTVNDTASYFIFGGLSSSEHAMCDVDLLDLGEWRCRLFSSLGLSSFCVYFYI